MQVAVVEGHLLMQPQVQVAQVAVAMVQLELLTELAELQILAGVVEDAVADNHPLETVAQVDQVQYGFQISQQQLQLRWD
jgi:hypothetical protein